MSASSGNGDITLRMASVPEPGDMRFSTGNGHIELTLPDDFGAELDSSFGNGRVDSDLPLTVSNRRRRGRVEGTIGDGGPRLRVSSGNGNLELRTAR